MKEIFLHHIWRFKLFSTQEMTTFHGDFIEIIKTGNINSNAGPDFLEAEIVIGDKLWIGSVEMHVNSSDWNLHQHSTDAAYENVILHVVWNHDCEINELRQRNVQTLILQDYVNPEIVYNYQNIINTKFDKIYCEDLINDLEMKQFSFWFERILIERFEEKTLSIFEELERNQSNWEQTLFRNLAKNFGLKVNVEAFEIWSNSFPFNVLQKVQTDTNKVEALFFGQAGFLEETIENEYYLNLVNEYKFLKTKFNLKPLDKSIFKFSKMRPIGFPTIRIAQLAGIYATFQQLFSKIIEQKNSKDYIKLFENLKINPFWENHYTFQSESKPQTKQISKDKINNIIINTILPIRYAFDRFRDENDIDFYIDLLSEIAPEKNSILDEFEKIGFHNKNAKDSQILIHLKKRYCSEKKCLNCAIGHHILR